MGARVSAKRIVAGRRNESNESEFDLDEDERRIKEIQEKNKQIVTYVVENLFPYAPVSIKIQRIDMPEDVKEKKKHVYLWITIDDHVLKQQNVPLDATFSYPLAVAVDITGDTYVTDRTNGQRRLKSQDILALATATTPPIPPDSVSLIEATGHSLRVGWREASGYLVANLAPKSILMFRLKAMNSVGETLWTESKPIRTKEFARPEVQELPSGGTDRWVECWDGKEEKVFYFNKVHKCFDNEITLL
ncbi:unnamed protein product [Aphanomyces euteiches]